MCKYMIEWTNQSQYTSQNNDYGKEKRLQNRDSAT